MAAFGRVLGIALASALLVALLLGRAILPLARAQAPEAWPMFRDNPQHTGVASTSIRPALPLEKRWAFQTGDKVWSSPAVWEGVVFVGSEDSQVYAFGPAPGAVPYVPPTPVPFVVRVGGGSQVLGVAVLVVIFIGILRIGLWLYRIAQTRARAKR